jgi:hypothetical protein
MDLSELFSTRLPIIFVIPEHDADTSLSLAMNLTKPSYVYFHAFHISGQLDQNLAAGINLRLSDKPEDWIKHLKEARGLERGIYIIHDLGAFKIALKTKQEIFALSQYCSESSCIFTTTQDSLSELCSFCSRGYIKWDAVSGIIQRFPTSNLLIY